ncbi:MAG: glycosyltransferase family 2 protein [Rikenellaceae bacterium]
MKIGVIVSTYNNPKWLQIALWALLNQTKLPDEVLIADDGSTEQTKEVIDRVAKNAPFKMLHIWHEDKGFRKCDILNKAVAASTAEYLIFIDQDCIARRDFLEAHAKEAQKGYLLSGGVVMLPMDVSNAIDEQNIKSGDAFNIEWLKSAGYKANFKTSKLWKSPLFAYIMNHITPAKATWNGGNTSTWREYIIAANGFNEDMKYGGEDREFGERLFNRGIKAKQLRYSAIMLHLDHKRPYKNQELIELNKSIRRNTRKNKITVTPHGIEKL